MTMQAEIFGLYLLLAFLSILAPFILVAGGQYLIKRVYRWRLKRNVKTYRALKKSLKLSLGEQDFEGEAREDDDGNWYLYISNEELRSEKKRLNELADEYGNQKAWWIVPMNMRMLYAPFRITDIEWDYKPFAVFVTRLVAKYDWPFAYGSPLWKWAEWQPFLWLKPFGMWAEKGRAFSTLERDRYDTPRPRAPKGALEVWQQFFYETWHHLGGAYKRFMARLHGIEMNVRFHGNPLPEMLRSQAMKKYWWIDEILRWREKIKEAGHPSNWRYFSYEGDVPNDGAWLPCNLGSYSRDEDWENSYVTMAFRRDIEEKFGEEGLLWMSENYRHWAAGWVEQFYIKAFEDARCLRVTKIAKWVEELLEDGLDDYRYEQDYYTVEDAQHVSELYYAADQFIDEELVPEQLLETYRLSWLMSRDWNTIWNGKDPEGLEVSKWQIENEELLSHDSFDHWGIPAWAVALKDVGHSESVYYDGEGNSRLMVAIELLEMAGWLDYDKLDEAARKETESKWGSGWNSVKNWRSDLANVKRADLAEILGIRYEPWIDPNREAKKRMKPMFTEKTETLTLYDWREADGRARKEDEDVEE